MRIKAATNCSEMQRHATSQHESCLIVCELPPSKFPCRVVTSVDVPAGRIRFSCLQHAAATAAAASRAHSSMSVGSVIDKKRYTIRKREMVGGEGPPRSMSFDNLELMSGDKLEVTILPGMQSSLLISICWVSSVIFLTVLFTYTYTTMQDMLWN